MQAQKLHPMITNNKVKSHTVKYRTLKPSSSLQQPSNIKLLMKQYPPTTTLSTNFRKGYLNDDDAIDDEFKSLQLASENEYEDDEYDGEYEYDDEFDLNNQPMEYPPLSTSVISRNPLVIKAIRKLMALQEQADIQRFVTRVVPSQLKPRNGHSRSDCCFSGNKSDCFEKETAKNKGNKSIDTKRKLASCCGPFLSCAIKHSKSNDFDEVPDYFIDPHWLKSELFYGIANPFPLQRPPIRPTFNRER